MDVIRVHRHLESETLHLPELRPLVGRNVEIIVVEEHGEPNAEVLPFDFDRHFGRGWPSERDDGFEESLKEWRKQDKPRDLPV